MAVGRSESWPGTGLLRPVANLCNSEQLQDLFMSHTPSLRQLSPKHKAAGEGLRRNVLWPLGHAGLP